MKNILTLILLTLTVEFLSSQTEVKKTKQLPSVAIGAGVLSFNGDLDGKEKEGSPFGKIKAGYTLSLEQRIGKYLGISLNGMYGKLADSERSKTRNLNFQSTIIQTNLNLNIHFDNLIFKKNNQFAPYIFVGIGYLKLDPYEDLTDENGIRYNYWNDGTIRSLPQQDVNAAYATMLQRDYSYETKRIDSTNSSDATFSVPVGIAFNLKMVDNLSVNIGGAYYFTFTDWIDNVKSGNNDSYVFANVSLQYTFIKKTTEVNKGFETVDFLSLDKLDTDEDGIHDNNDQCQGTPKGVKVNTYGCPEDNDGDGIPDYRDKELTTKNGAMVDTEGVTQTNEMIAERQKKNKIEATERSQVFNQNPSLAYLKDLDIKAAEKRKNNPNKTPIPPALKSADINNDGYISVGEMTATIFAFFEGSSDFTAEKLNDLVDFYFEQ